MQYAGVERSDGGYRDVETCAELVEFLEGDRSEYVAINATANHLGEWVTTQPDARLVTTQPVGRGFEVLDVYRLDPKRRDRAC